MGSEDHHVPRPIPRRRRVRARSPHWQSSTEHADKSACIAGAITSHSTDQVAGTSIRHHAGIIIIGNHALSRVKAPERQGCQTPAQQWCPVLSSGKLSCLKPGSKEVLDGLQAQTCSTASLRFVNVLGGQAALVLMFLLHRRLHPASDTSQSMFMVRLPAEIFQLVQGSGDSSMVWFLPKSSARVNLLPSSSLGL